MHFENTQEGFSNINKYLGIDNFSDEAFNKQIKLITVLPDNILRILSTDDKETDIRWEDPKRSNGWTPEMREAARQRTIQQWKKRGDDGKWQKLQ